MEIQLRHIGAPVGLYTTDVGHLNQCVQFWAYDSYAAMDARCGARDRERAWAEYLKAAESLVVAENVRTVRRVPGL